jgi:hypothetical protein
MQYRVGQIYKIAVLVSSILCICFSSAKAIARDFTVAASLIQDHLDLTQLECVSIRSAVIFGRSYVSEVMELIDGKLATRVMPEAQGNCPFIFSSTALRQKTRAVKYFGRPASVFINFATCKKDADGKVGRNSCTYKNVYLFRDDLLPLEVFEVGFKAFMRKQDAEWALMKIALGDNT